jgi:RNA polymerase sigma-70 factor (ECF subfamily)
LRAARASGLSRERAEDVVQATFLTFVEKADTFDGRARVRTWLFGILYRKLLEAFRAAQRDQQADDIDGLVDQRFEANGTWVRPPAPVDTHLHAREVRQRIDECLDQLTDRYRMAFVLREVEQLSTEEICKIMEINANNLGVILFRARNRLRECLEAGGVKGSQDAHL